MKKTKPPKVSFAGVHPTWRAVLAPYVEKVPAKVWRESIVPPDRVFQAFKYSGLIMTKVVILGQDPFHHPGKANGLCFGLSSAWIERTGGKDASSFGNLVREAEAWEVEALGEGEAYGVQDMTLESWADQGVLMMNTRLTVAANKPMSHANVGWEEATGAILKLLAERKTPVVFICLGAEARKAVRKYVKKGSHHEVISTSHPCKYSAKRGFIGSGVFGKANEALMGFGEEPIDWCQAHVSSKPYRFG